MSDALAELAPHGVLRFAVNLSNAALTRYAEGRLTGPAPEAAARIAARLGVPLDLRPYRTAGAILAGMDEWDAAILAVDPSRSQFAFSPPIATVEAMVAVASGSVLQRLEDLDRPDLRIATADGAVYSAHLTRVIKQATILAVADPGAALAMLRSGECEAAAGLRQGLEELAERERSLRLLPEPFASMSQAVAVRSGHQAALALIVDALWL